MPLIAGKIKKDIEAAVLAALTSEFSKEASADPKSHQKLAKAISAIADVIVLALTVDAQVAPGIPTAGSPAAQVTTGPGKII